MLVVECGVFFLEVAGIRQQNAAKVNGRGRRIDRPGEALPDEARNVSAVIQVSVRKNDCVDLARRYRTVLPVALAPFLLSLEESAIDQHLYSAGAVVVGRSIDQVLGTRDSAGRAEELNVGQTNLRGHLASYTSGAKARIFW